MTARSIARFAGRHLTDEIQVQRWKGRGSDEQDIYENLGLFNGKLIEKSSTLFDARSDSQKYDAVIIMKSGISFSEPNDSYKITATEYKTGIESTDPDGEPEVKRTRYFRLASVDAMRDNTGTDVLQVLRCVSARDEAES